MYLTLFDNPIFSQTYRPHIIEILPQIKALDFLIIADFEKLTENSYDSMNSMHSVYHKLPPPQYLPSVHQDKHLQALSVIKSNKARMK